MSSETLGTEKCVGHCYHCKWGRLAQTKQLHARIYRPYKLIYVGLNIMHANSWCVMCNQLMHLNEERSNQQTQKCFKIQKILKVPHQWYSLEPIQSNLISQNCFCCLLVTRTIQISNGIPGNPFKPSSS